MCAFWVNREIEIYIRKREERIKRENFYALLGERNTVQNAIRYKTIFFLLKRKKHTQCNLMEWEIVRRCENIQTHKGQKYTRKRHTHTKTKNLKWNFEMNVKRTKNKINEKIIKYGTKKIRKEKFNWLYSLAFYNIFFFLCLFDDTCAYVKYIYKCSIVKHV